MLKRCLKVLGLFLVFLITGCATVSNSPARSDMLSIKHKYDTQLYGECMQEIDVFLKKYSAPTGAWALLTMTKAMCLEETGNPERSDALYRGIIDFVPNTLFADRAGKRLSRQDGDQKEHFELDFSRQHWRRAKKDWSYTASNSLFIPEGRTAKNSDECVFVVSADRPHVVKTLENALERISSEVGLSGGNLKIVEIERASDEGMWNFYNSGNGKIPASAAVLRIVLTPNRMHSIVFVKKGTQIPEIEKENWVAVLKSAKLVTTH